MSGGDDEDPFPNWSVPATKGDVLQAMIWSQGLALRVMSYAEALDSGDRQKIAAARAGFYAEWKGYSAKVTELAGRNF